VKIADFGCSKILDPEKDKYLTTANGSIYYTAPEVFL